MFEVRNPAYAFAHIRKLPSVRRALYAPRKANPACAYCGRTKGVHVHHIKPVSIRPDLAGMRFNLLTLCGKRCHITIGHMGNWRTYNAYAELVCKASARDFR